MNIWLSCHLLIHSLVLLSFLVLYLIWHSRRYYANKGNKKGELRGRMEMKCSHLKIHQTTNKKIHTYLQCTRVFTISKSCFDFPSFPSKTQVAMWVRQNEKMKRFCIFLFFSSLLKFRAINKTWFFTCIGLTFHFKQMHFDF